MHNNNQRQSIVRLSSFLAIKQNESDDVNRLNRIRNIGIFAHVDAGKTTVTERMLGLAGVVHRVGSVDDGNTVTDYLPQERERGITIQAAAISFEWARHNHNNNHVSAMSKSSTTDFVNIHLIDTPGHVDFSVEVNRSVAVLDGAVLVVDAVAGVQAQTESVWRAITNQTRKSSGVTYDQKSSTSVTQDKEQKIYNDDNTTIGHEPLSCIAFINKMDKDGCNFTSAVSSLKRKLPRATPIPIQIPLFRVGSIMSADHDLSHFTDSQILSHMSANSTNHGNFAGVVDLIHMRAVIYPEVKAMELANIESSVPLVLDLINPNNQLPVDTDSPVIREAMKARRHIVECLADYDEVIEECYLSDRIPTNHELLEAIRRATVSRRILPVLTGAAVKGKGVEPLLDAVVDFLPSPLDRLPPTIIRYDELSKKKKNKTVKRVSTPFDQSLIPLGHPLHSTLTALAFKVIHMKNRGGSGDGRVVFTRIFSGKISTKDTLLIITPGTQVENINIRSERVSGMLELAGGRFDNVEDGLCQSGDVCALIGLKSVVTGDTILISPQHSSSQSIGKKIKNRTDDFNLEELNTNFYLAGVSSPKPVLSVRIEAESSDEQKKLSEALRLLSVEDPSLHVEETEATTILSGLGELHIEIIVDRLRREFGLSVRIGKPAVTYRETVTESIESSGLIEYDRIIGTNRLQASIQLGIEPLKSDAEITTVGSSCISLGEPVIDIGKNARDYLGLPMDEHVDELVMQSELARALVSGCLGALKRGSLGSFSHANVRCTITEIEANGGLAYLNSMPGSLRAAASYAVSSTLNSNKSSCSILEPMMGIEVTIPSNMVGIVVSDLSSRRGSISDVIMDDDTQMTEDTKAVVIGEVPLAEILGYANALRSLTGGEGSFSAEYRGHSPSVTRF